MYNYSWFWSHLFTVSFSTKYEIADVPSDWLESALSHRWKNTLELFSVRLYDIQIIQDILMQETRETLTPAAEIPQIQAA